MEKIPSLFMRNYETDRLIRDEAVPEAAWALAGEGQPTRKYDGTCCLVRGGVLYKRHEVKPGGTPPPRFEAATGVDDTTGKRQGWLPVGDGPEDRWHREAWAAGGGLPDGTYELIGPKIQGNPERAPAHVLVPHGAEVLAGVPRTFAGIRAYLAGHDIEGIVFRQEDGRRCKVKAKDYGIKRGGGQMMGEQRLEAILGETLRAGLVRRWLEGKDPAAIVGVSLEAMDCPLSRYLLDATGVALGVTRSGILDKQREYVPMPEDGWAVRFVAAVDDTCVPPGRVTAGDALAIMDRIGA